MSSLQLPVYKQFLAKLTSIDFYEIARLLKNQGWKRKQIAAAISDYCKYLFLGFQNPGEVLIPTTQIDAVLHAHLSLGIQFDEDCKRLLGCVVHHQPGLGNGDDADRQEWLMAFQRTSQLFQKAFGVGLTDAPGHCFTMTMTA
jgi:hypothetical protein